MKQNRALLLETKSSIFFPRNRALFSEMDIQSLEPRRDFDRQQPTKKRKLQDVGRREKRQKVDSSEDKRGKRQDSMDED